MLTYEDYIEWIKLTYSDEDRYYGYELMWKPDQVPNQDTMIDKNNRIKELNKKMIEEFPFLLPRNRWTDKVQENYDYSYNEWQAIELGWQINFGWKLLHELNIIVSAMEHPEKFRITQIKEKFGEFRLYSNGGSDVWQLIDDYTELSRKVCMDCGQPATVASVHPIAFFCDRCAKNHDRRYVPIQKWFNYWDKGEPLDE